MEEEKRCASFPSRIQEKIHSEINAIEESLPAHRDRASFVQRRLHYLCLVFDRDEEMKSLPLETLFEMTRFSYTVGKLVTLSPDDFLKVEIGLAYQELFAPLSQIKAFNLILNANTSSLLLMNKFPILTRPLFVSLYATTTNDLAKAIVDAKQHTSENGSIGFICNIQGVMTSEIESSSHKKWKKRNGIKPLFDILSKQRDVCIAATSENPKYDNALQTLRDIELDNVFNVGRKDNFKTIPANQILQSSGDIDSLSGSIEVWRHGRVAAARKKGNSRHSHLFLAKGIALSAVYPEQKFSTVIVADENVSRVDQILESLMLSKTWPYLKYIYFVLVDPKAKPSADKLTRSTRTELSSAFLNN